MKKTFFVVVFVFVSAAMFGQETNDQAANRAKNFANEWNTLVDMQESLSGESKIKLWNYMMGFAEGAYQLCKDLHSSSLYNFSYEKDVFFNCYQDRVQRVGARTLY